MFLINQSNIISILNSAIVGNNYIVRYLTKFDSMRTFSINGYLYTKQKNETEGAPSLWFLFWEGEIKCVTVS